MATISLNSNIIRSATMMENQFSFLLTLFLLSKFLKQVLIIFTMISWFDGASIINYSGPEGSHMQIKNVAAN